MLPPLERLREYVRPQVAFCLANIERVAVYHHDLERLGDERRRDIVGRRRAHERFVTGLLAEAQADGDVSRRRGPGAAQPLRLRDDDPDLQLVPRGPRRPGARSPTSARTSRSAA